MKWWFKYIHKKAFAKLGFSFSFVKENKEILINWSFSDTPFTLKGEPQQHASNWSNREVFADQLGDTLFSLVTGGCHGASDCGAVSLWPDLFVPTRSPTSSRPKKPTGHFLHISSNTVNVMFQDHLCPSFIYSTLPHSHWASRAAMFLPLQVEVFHHDLTHGNNVMSACFAFIWFS